MTEPLPIHSPVFSAGVHLEIQATDLFEIDESAFAAKCTQVSCARSRLDRASCGAVRKLQDDSRLLHPSTRGSECALRRYAYAHCD